jgi:xylono-1,5-lactonase
MMPKTQDIQALPIWKGRATLGESLLWSPSRNRLFFVDILGKRVLSCAIDGSGVQQWAMPRRVCWLVECAGSGDFLVGLEDSIVYASFIPGAPVEILRNLDWRLALPPTARFNDAKADATGRVYCGTMDDKESAPIGALFTIAPGGAVAQLDAGYTVTNGPAISPDGATLYHTDSPARTVYAFKRAPGGMLSAKRPHIHFAEADGYPDGMTCDAEGGLWVAHWDGGRVSRFHPDGSFDRGITVPASRVTSCTFCGPNFDRLAITTAAYERESEPLAGALFIADPGCVGLAAGRYGLAA